MWFCHYQSLHTAVARICQLLCVSKHSLRRGCCGEQVGSGVGHGGHVLRHVSRVHRRYEGCSMANRAGPPHGRPDTTPDARAQRRDGKSRLVGPATPQLHSVGKAQHRLLKVCGCSIEAAGGEGEGKWTARADDFGNAAVGLGPGLSVCQTGMWMPGTTRPWFHVWKACPVLKAHVLPCQCPKQAPSHLLAHPAATHSPRPQVPPRGMAPSEQTLSSTPRSAPSSDQDAGEGRRSRAREIGAPLTPGAL